MNGQYDILTVPMELIDFSKTNPRKRTNGTAITELAESLRRDGLLNPLTVRQHPANNGRYELVAGERRFKAAQKLKWSTVDVVVRKLADDEVLALQLVENIQREDLDPLDESAAFDRLISKCKMSVDQIAESVGKSESYIYQRLKLRWLIPQAKKLYRNADLTLGHVLELCVLSKEQQEEALGHIEDAGASLTDLRNFIRNHIMLELSRAPFDRKVTLAGVGPCAKCEKQTGYMPSLFPGLTTKDARCLDGQCYNAKCFAHVAAVLAELGDDAVKLSTQYNRSVGVGRAKIPEDVLTASEYVKTAKLSECENGKKGVIVDTYRAEELGKVLTVCLDNKCQVHYGRGGSTLTQKERDARKADKEKAEKEKAFRQSVYDQIMMLVGVNDLLNGDLVRIIVAKYFDRLHHDIQKEVCTILGWELVKYDHGGGYDLKATATPKIEALDEPHDLLRVLLTIAAGETLKGPPVWDKVDDTLLSMAAHYGIDLKETRADSDKLYLETKGKRRKVAKKTTKGKTAKRRGMIKT